MDAPAPDLEPNTNTPDSPSPYAGVAPRDMNASDEAKARGKAVLAERRARKQANMAKLKKANKAKELKKYRRAVIKEKVQKGVPITEEEVIEISARSKTLAALCKTIPQNVAEAAIVLKPHTINALRLIVEQTAAQHGYNPISGLLEELKDPDLSAKDRVAIHKTLLPFLMPQIAPAKEEHVEHAPQASKIILKNFHLPKDTGIPLHQSKKGDLAPAIEMEPEAFTAAQAVLDPANTAYDARTP